MRVHAITESEFDKLLESFSENGNLLLRMKAVQLATSKSLWNNDTSQIKQYKKQSLIRKALRFVATVAVSGTYDVDAMSRYCSFNDFKDGNAVSFGEDKKWSFYSSTLKRTIYVNILGNKARYYDDKHRLYGSFDVKNIRWNKEWGRQEIVSEFESTMKKIISAQENLTF